MGFFATGGEGRTWEVLRLSGIDEDFFGEDEPDVLFVDIVGVGTWADGCGGCLELTAVPRIMLASFARASLNCSEDCLAPWSSVEWLRMFGVLLLLLLLVLPPSRLLSCRC